MLGNGVIPDHLMQEVLNAFRQANARVNQYSVFDKRHVQQGIEMLKLSEGSINKMTEEDKMQRDYENVLDDLRIAREYSADRDTEIVELKKHIESNHEDLRAARKLRKEHEREIKLLTACKELLEAEQRNFLYQRDEKNARDHRVESDRMVSNLRAEYERLLNLGNNTSS